MSSLNRRRGKENERYLAKRFKGRRLGTLGRIDVEIPGCAVECKSRKRMPALIVQSMNQAAANRLNGENQLPVVHIHERGADHDKDMMIMRIGDWEILYKAWRAGQ